MSVISNPSPLPGSSPEQLPRPHPLPSEPKKPRPWKLWLVVALMAAAGWVAYRLVAKSRQAQPGTAAAVVGTAKVSAGTIERVLRLGGETSARNFASITVPIMRGPDARREMVLIKLAKAGTFVKQGDVVAEIDTQAAQDHIDDVTSNVVQAESDIKKRKAEQAVDWENLQQTLRVAKAELDQAKLDYQAAEVRTTIDQELLKLAVEEAEARYKQLQEDLASQQATQKAELRILEITRTRHIMHRQRHINDLNRATFHAPIGGLVVMQTFFRGGEMSQIELGDQVRSGQTFMKIVDVSSMQVEASVNQADSSELRVGRPATVILDAFPGLRFKGRVYSIGAMGVRSWRENYYIRSVPVRIAIEGTDPRLIPDLSAAADVVLERKEDALVVPLEAVHADKGKQVVFVKKAGKFERREVTLGLQNATHAAALSGLEAGDEVALGPVSVLSASVR